MEDKKQFETQKEKLSTILNKIENKESKLYFFTLDTKGNPTAGIANIYEHVKILNELGYNATILHEKNDYRLNGDDSGMGIREWLGSEYANLPHTSIEGGKLNINPEDFIVIPEVFSSIMDQLKNFNCKKIVFSQSYDYIFELLPIGKRWTDDYGFNDVITTSNKQAEFLVSHFPTIKTHVIPVSIPSYFKNTDKLKKPIIAIHTRNQSDSSKIAKSFYLQYPLYKWVTFKDLRGVSRTDFASELSKCCLAVWVDDQSGFGTFPLEAIKCETPVIGKIPNMIPEWMEHTDSNGEVSIKNNGVWTNTTLNLPELIATYLKVWLEDSVPQELINGMNDTKQLYTEESQKEIIKNVYSSIIDNRIDEVKKAISVIDEKITTLTN